MIKDLPLHPACLQQYATQSEGQARGASSFSGPPRVGDAATKVVNAIIAKATGVKRIVIGCPVIFELDFKYRYATYVI